MVNRLEVKRNTLNCLLRDEKVDEVNKQLALGVKPEFASTDFRALHLQGLIVEGVDFSNSYFRMADLRGIDFSTCNLEGASLHSASISGCLFPKELSAEEISMSVEHGTRMRYI